MFHCSFYLWTVCLMMFVAWLREFVKRNCTGRQRWTLRTSSYYSRRFGMFDSRFASIKFIICSLPLCLNLGATNKNKNTWSVPRRFEEDPASLGAKPIQEAASQPTTRWALSSQGKCSATAVHRSLWGENRWAAAASISEFERQVVQYYIIARASSYHYGW